jgi:membrane protease YdiL (CAAX protease family)
VAVPPGWYPDPWQVAGWRWWDGQQWTAHAGGPVPYALPPTPPAYPNDDESAHVASWPAVAVGILGAVALSAIGAYSFDALGAPAVLGGLIGVWTSLLVAVALAARTRSLPVRRLFAAPKTFGAWCGAIGIGVGGGLVIRIASGIAGSPLIHWVQEESRTRAPIDGIDISGTTAVLLAFGAICVGAPLLEELFFRGVLLPTLARRLPVQPAMVVQALVFATLHLTYGIGAATAAFTILVIGVAGYGLAFLRVKTHSLVPSIVAHATFNAVALAAAIWLVN